MKLIPSITRLLRKTRPLPLGQIPGYRQSFADEADAIQRKDMRAVKRAQDERAAAIHRALRDSVRAA